MDPKPHESVSCFYFLAHVLRKTDRTKFISRDDRVESHAQSWEQYRLQYTNLLLTNNKQVRMHNSECEMPKSTDCEHFGD